MRASKTAMAARTANQDTTHQDDISKLPEIIKSVKSGQSITIGDLHGNGVLMLYFLIKNGVLQLKDQGDYQRFADAHNTLYRELVFDPYITAVKNSQTGNLCIESQTIAISNLIHKPNLAKKIADALKEIKGVITNATVTNQKCQVRFIGDMLSDRGPCDYSILLLLKKLGQRNVTTRILYSNHDLGFMEYYPFSTKSAFKPEFGMAQQSSLKSMLALIQTGLLKAAEVNSLVHNHYLPNLRLVHISLNPYLDTDGVTKTKFYMHAPNSLEQLRRLVANLHPNPYAARDLSSTDIGKFSQIIAETNTYFLMKLNNNNLSPKEKGALWEFVWTRNEGQKLDYGPTLKAFHGHDGKANIASGNLNGEIGKAVLDQFLANFNKLLAKNKGSADEAIEAFFDKMDGNWWHVSKAQMNRFNHEIYKTPYNADEGDFHQTTSDDYTTNMTPESVVNETDTNAQDAKNVSTKPATSSEQQQLPPITTRPFAAVILAYQKPTIPSGVTEPNLRAIIDDRRRALQQQQPTSPQETVDATATRQAEKITEAKQNEKTLPPLGRTGDAGLFGTLGKNRNDTTTEPQPGDSKPKI